MAGSLVKIAETTVSSAVASVTLTGIDSTYDVYVAHYNNVEIDTDSRFMLVQFTTSGTPDTSANYDYAAKDLRADTSFGNDSVTNETSIATEGTGTNTGEQINNTLYLFNFNNSSEYSFITTEGLGVNTNGALRGRQGGGVLTVAQACDGIHFKLNGTGNFDSGSFVLYGLKK
jgi:hypothetical protein